MLEYTGSVMNRFISMIFDCIGEMRSSFEPISLTNLNHGDRFLHSTVVFEERANNTSLYALQNACCTSDAFL